MTDDPDNSVSQNQPETTQETQDNSKAFNFAQMRRKQAELEAQNAEMRQALEGLKNSAQVPKSTSQQSIYQEYGIEPGSLLEGEKFANALEKEREKMRAEAKQSARQTYDEIERERYPKKLRERYRDFDEVVTAENAEYLEAKDPQFARAVSMVPNMYERCEMAYAKIKELKALDQKPKVSAQEIVDKNKSASYHYAPGGVDSTGNGGAARSLLNDPAAKAQEYAKLKAAQKRAVQIK